MGSECSVKNQLRSRQALVTQLTAVEQRSIRVLLDMLGTGNHGRRFDAELVAALDDLQNVKDIDEDGGHGGAEHEAGRTHVSCLSRKQPSYRRPSGL